MKPSRMRRLMNIINPMEFMTNMSINITETRLVTSHSHVKYFNFIDILYHVVHTVIIYILSVPIPT